MFYSLKLYIDYFFNSNYLSEGRASASNVSKAGNKTIVRM